MIKKLLLSGLFSLAFSLNAFAKPNIVVSYPYIEDLVNKIGKDKVSVFAFSKGTQDPHFIVPKPSLIAKARNADLLILNGADLEVGWIPPIVKQASNPNIQSGSKGYLDLSKYINLIEKPSNLSRADGDVHPEGNPHFLLNPNNVLIISKVITKKLSELDPSNKQFYNANNLSFTKKWNEKLVIWNQKMKNSKVKKVIQYHKLYNYFLDRFKIKTVDTLEPLPGITPTSSHLAKVMDEIKTENVKLILQDVYHNSNSSKLVAERTNINYVLLPHDVGATTGAKDVFSLFDEIVDKFSN